MTKSAVARLQATGMLQTTATRSRALTSGSCGCGSSGSRRNTSRSISPSAMRAPICWSPPYGCGVTVLGGGDDEGNWSQRYKTNLEKLASGDLIQVVEV